MPKWKIPLSYPALLLRTGCNPQAVRIYCPYCRQQLTDLEIAQLHEEDTDSRNRLFHAVCWTVTDGVKARFYGACAHCRLFLTNA
ncbi:E6 [Duck papillomavirus 3]|uniref:E6 n=1 Tax=Duck papillomavirus 3 TaxID=2562546 RepID=A0AAE5YMJ9_9PAPI|nr:E6 [Duck papillomavirus 3]